MVVHRQRILYAMHILTVGHDLARGNVLHGGVTDKKRLVHGKRTEHCGRILVSKKGIRFQWNVEHPCASTACP